MERESRRSIKGMLLRGLERKTLYLCIKFTMNYKDYVVVIGGANVDIGGTPHHSLIPEDSNPGIINITFGGVGRNIAHNLVNLGVKTSLITAVGNDPFGKEILNYCESIGIDTEYSIKVDDVRSSMYMYINDDEGNMKLAVSDMDICSMITPAVIDEHLELINNASAVVADCNLTHETLMHIKEVCKAPVFIDTVSVNKSPKIKDNLDGLYAIKPNMLEAGYLAGMKIENSEDCAAAALKLLDQGVEKVFISMDEEGILAADKNRIYITENYKADPLNTTGAGDSATAAVVWAYLLNDDEDYLITASKAANAAAAMTIEVRESINNEITPEKLMYRINNSGINIEIIK